MRDDEPALTVRVADDQGLRWAQERVTQDHSLRAPVDRRSRPWAYRVRHTAPMNRRTEAHTRSPMGAMIAGAAAATWAWVFTEVAAAVPAGERAAAATSAAEVAAAWSLAATAWRTPGADDPATMEAVHAAEVACAAWARAAAAWTKR